MSPSSEIEPQTTCVCNVAELCMRYTGMPYVPSTQVILSNEHGSKFNLKHGRSYSRLLADNKLMTEKTFTVM